MSTKSLTKSSCSRLTSRLRKDLLERIEFIETLSTKKIQAKYNLSKSWWVAATKEQRLEISRAVLKFFQTLTQKRKEGILHCTKGLREFK